MNANLVVGVYVVAVLLALGLILVYRAWFKKNHRSGQSVALENTGLPIKNGLKHFKLVNE